MRLKIFLACIVFAAGFYSGGIVHPFHQTKPAANAYEVYFCPEDACSSQIIGQIDRAQSYIYVAMYSFTLDSIADALIRARNRGVDVKVVMEKSQIGRGSEYGRLKNAGIDVRLDKNSDYMHNKFMVVDGKLITTGSFNWSLHADTKNDENLLILYSEELAEKYKEEFFEPWS
ncbi:MAG: phospholipase D family protein [Candidatus Hydrothermarchaeota archaeon]|nr:phospholipase D family protein [Candidatus Hydrothermarchaeota archaeon]